MSLRLPVEARIYVAGHDSPLGHMLCRKLQMGGYRHIITRSPQELNLRNQLDVNLFFEHELPDYVFVVNDHSGQVDEVIHPAEYLYGRLTGLSNIIHASYVYEVSKLLNIVFSADQLDMALSAHLGEERDGPSSEDLIQSVTLGLCDRYRQQYHCDFITARFHLNTSADRLMALQGASAAQGLLLDTAGMANPASLSAGAGLPSDQFYSPDPTDACLFLMEHFSSTGIISVRSEAFRFVVP